MSIQFSDTGNKKGLVQLYENELNFADAYVSGDTTRLKQFTADINVAYDDFIAIAIPSSGTWQFDDTNHTDFPEITTNLVASQRDYTFTTEESGNLILDIYRVFVKDSANGVFREVFPVDKQTAREGIVTGLTDGADSEGAPHQYDKTANGILLDPIPDSAVTNGLKVLINREASYFTTTDTTKKPGVDGRLHHYFYRRPALEHKRRKKMISYNEYKDAVNELKKEIEDVYGARERDVRPIMKPEPIIYE